ncbi:MAG: hypothetical protein AAFN17_14050, partial [Pseudomonadota bacterium]
MTVLLVIAGSFLLWLGGAPQPEDRFLGLPTGVLAQAEPPLAAKTLMIVAGIWLWMYAGWRIGTALGPPQATWPRWRRILASLAGGLWTLLLRLPPSLTRILGAAVFVLMLPQVASHVAGEAVRERLRGTPAPAVVDLAALDGTAEIGALGDGVVRAQIDTARAARHFEPGRGARGGDAGESGTVTYVASLYAAEAREPAASVQAILYAVRKTEDAGREPLSTLLGDTILQETQGPLGPIVELYAVVDGRLAPSWSDARALRDSFGLSRDAPILWIVPPEGGISAHRAAQDAPMPQALMAVIGA